MTNLGQATREVMWNMTSPWHTRMMYVLFIVSVLIFAYGAWRKVALWKRGKPAGEIFTDIPARLWLMVREFLLQVRVRDSIIPAIFHSFIFYGFAVLVVTTAVVAIDFDLGTSFFNGWIYVILSVGADFAGFIILVGVGMAVWRRYIKKPATLKTVFMDTWALLLVACLVLTGFLAEGLRIAFAGDPWAMLTPFGWLTSLLFLGASEDTGRVLHVVFWWTHTGLALTWIATMPFTKFVHILLLPTNVFLSKMKPRGALDRVDIEAMMSAEDFDEESFNVGVANAEQFSWKQRMDFDACIECGRCEEVCPASQADQPFSPKTMVQAFKTAMYKAAQAGKDGDGKKVELSAIVGDVFDEEFLWFCRTCTACMEVCPAMIDHVGAMMEVRRNEVIMQGRMPAEAARAMRSLENLGNPFGPQSDRVDWISDLGVRIVKPGEKAEVIYWIGCCTTFDPTKQKIASDLCKLLKRAGIDYGVLGSDERCCGDPARVMGEENQFQAIAKAQVEELNKREFDVLLVSCPHCYNVLAHEYPQFGGKYHVAHHSEFLHEMLWNGTLKPKIGERSRMVYHDPCYLGRYQKIYDAPREVIKALPGSSLVEMRNFRERSLCCGGGGGHFWMDIKKGKRINNLRVEQAQEAQADTIVTSCAYCMQMINDSVKLNNAEDDIRVMDLATLVLNSLGEADKK